MFIRHMKIGGAEALAGLGVTTPVILFLSSFAALVSMGGAPKAVIALGKKEKDKAERIMGSCTALLIVISVFLTAGMLIYGKKRLEIITTMYIAWNISGTYADYGEYGGNKF